jgi:thiol-disulfide isomerase/thioredoxin
MSMQPAQAHGAPNGRPALMMPWRLVLLAFAAALGMLAVVLGLRLFMPSLLPQTTLALSTVGITLVIPPRSVSPLAFSDASGRPLTLADFRGRAVLLNLWATWCVPCRQEMPSLDRLQAKFGGPRFQVIAVSIDKQGVATVEPFYRDLGLRSLGINLDPSGATLAVLGIEGIPVTLLIDPQGREIGRKLGALEWDSPAVVVALRKSFEITERAQ